MGKPSSKDEGSSSSSLRDHGIYLLAADIDESSVPPVIEWILEENLKAKKRQKRLQLIVSSRGGYVTDCFSLIDAMAGSAIPIDTLGLGCIASCGLTIFLHGEKRAVTPNTYVLSHQFSGGNYGKHHELLAGRKGEDWMSERLTTIYAARTGLSPKEVRKQLLCESDVHIDAEEALKLGIATEIRLC